MYNSSLHLCKSSNIILRGAGCYTQCPYILDDSLLLSYTLVNHCALQNQYNLDAKLRLLNTSRHSSSFL